jgi:ribosomal protein S18 acetylase RimI-like enzyme
VALGPEHDAAVADLLDEAFPTTTSRPGDARVRRWYGIYRDDRLVACAADRSRSGVGFLAGIAVHPASRGSGLGTAITVALTRRLHREFGVVALGVMADEERTAALYARLGYVAALSRSSVALR